MSEEPEDPQPASKGHKGSGKFGWCITSQHQGSGRLPECPGAVRALVCPCQCHGLATGPQEG